MIGLMYFAPQEQVHSYGTQDQVCDATRAAQIIKRGLTLKVIGNLLSFKRPSFAIFDQKELLYTTHPEFRRYGNVDDFVTAWSTFGTLR